jgi:outer membrane receptor protein involved in Fe transport
MFEVVVGGEYRKWIADHYAYSYNFRHHDMATGEVDTWHQVQNRYDYTTNVTNMSGFGRLLIRPIEDLTLMVDGQYASYKSVVDENPVEIFDFGAGEWSGESYRTTMDLKNPDGSWVFGRDEYERTYSFFSPKFGLNYNLTDQLNVMANYSISNKEPKSYQWYDRDKGPGTSQPDEQELEPEKSTNMEFGIGYQSAGLGAKVNYYHTQYEDKIESVQDLQGDWSTLNAGKALHQGVEVELNGQAGNMDFAGSLSWAKNRWQEMKVQTIFDADAEDVVDKVVPFSPERMASASVGYRFGKIRLGLGLSWWDEYYATYTNEYTTTEGDVEEAKLPYFMDLSANISIPIEFGGTVVNLRLDFNNILNRSDNYFKAEYSKDYNRNDALSGVYHWYVLQAPLFNTFLTMEVTF